MNTTPARFALVVGDWFDGETRRGPATLKVVDGCLAGVAEGDQGAALAALGWPLTRGAFLMPGLVDAHVHLFLDMHDVGDALVRARFADPVLDIERYTLTYPDVPALMRELKGIGAHNVLTARARGLTGRGRLAAMIAAYERERRDGVLPASYEVVYGHAWAPEQKLSVERDGVATFPLSGLRRRGAPERPA